MIMMIMVFNITVGQVVRLCHSTVWGPWQGQKQT